MKMDHHCPWINNCVGHFNHGKYVIIERVQRFRCFFKGGGWLFLNLALLGKYLIERLKYRRAKNDLRNVA